MGIRTYFVLEHDDPHAKCDAAAVLTPPSHFNP